MDKKPTMKDVAVKAGVALGTVSRVLNGANVSDKNRAKVEAAIKALNYEVNSYARGLKTGKTGIIAVIIPDITNPFFAALVNQIANTLEARNKRLLLCCSHEDIEKEREYLYLAVNNKIDGIIALTYSDISASIPPNLPIVAFDRAFENKNIPRVASDNFEGAVLAVSKLLEFGCRHPVYIRFHSAFPGESDKRKEGYISACYRFGLEPDYLDVLDSDRHLEQMQAFIDAHRLPDGSLSFDGAFVHTDFHGYEFKQLLTAAGYRVPEDVQIIGFDGVRLFGNAETGLYISSICQPVEALAEKCVDLLLEESSMPSLTILPVSYRYGGTTLE